MDHIMKDNLKIKNVKEKVNSILAVEINIKVNGKMV